MKQKPGWLLGLTIGLSLIGSSCGHPADAQVLFTSGTSNYNSGGEDINDYDVVDSFTLNSTDTITGINTAIWTDQGDSLQNLGFEISSGIDTVTVFASNDNEDVTDGTIYSSANDYGYQVENDSISTSSLTLGPGRYYLTLYNPTTASGDYAYWDDVTSATSSSAYLNGGYNANESTNASTFQILGTPASTTSTPEPSPLTAICLGLCAVGFELFFMIRRKDRIEQL